MGFSRQEVHFRAHLPPQLALQRLHNLCSLSWHTGASADDDLRWLWGPRTVIMCSISGELRLYGLIDHRHWLLRSNNIFYCVHVRCLAVGCSHHVNSSKILAVWTKRSADTLTNVILSCHSIRDARNLSRVCCYCGYVTTGSSLTARRAACTLMSHLRAFQTQGARCHENHAGPQRQRT
jgi:hypothetical protein